MTPKPANRHVAYVELDLESFHRGGSTRTAACTCGWRGPQRATLDLIASDALAHERRAFAHAIVTNAPSDGATLIDAWRQIFKWPA